jgi:hypothetical protein
MTDQPGPKRFPCAHCGAARHLGAVSHQVPGKDQFFRVAAPCGLCQAPRFELLDGADPTAPGMQPRYGEDRRDQANGRDIFRRGTSTSRPAYTLPDPPGTVREKDYSPGMDRVIFPVTRNNVIARMGEDDLQNTEGALWPLQQAIADSKFALLKRVIAEGHHMVGPIRARVVIEMECRMLTNKAASVVKVPPGVETIDMLLPNGDLRFANRR